jgi:hypothetical protein
MCRLLALICLLTGRGKVMHGHVHMRIGGVCHAPAGRGEATRGHQEDRSRSVSGGGYPIDHLPCERGSVAREISARVLLPLCGRVQRAAFLARPGDELRVWSGGQRDQDDSNQAHSSMLQQTQRELQKKRGPIMTVSPLRLVHTWRERHEAKRTDVLAERILAVMRRRQPDAKTELLFSTELRARFVGAEPAGVFGALGQLERDRLIVRDDMTGRCMLANKR